MQCPNDTNRSHIQVFLHLVCCCCLQAPSPTRRPSPTIAQFTSLRMRFAASSSSWPLIKCVLPASQTASSSSPPPSSSSCLKPSRVHLYFSMYTATHLGNERGFFSSIREVVSLDTKLQIEKRLEILNIVIESI